ncbi:hypothetical protein Raf01_06010 [Rugosimonospora africana]|uniref:Type VII secretion system protein EccE domain-containing protein n=1 Tax=Rugosimonospora africana TaxID=556532 RepID=A0A8J3VMN4_9ACTN|nr:hypothetical protein Raf01_06010 [Rugosimonospora africana]
MAAQVAVLVLLLAALSHGALAWSLATPVAVALIALVGVRWRHRWLHAWLATAVRYLVRARTPPAGSGATALLGWVEPTACYGAQPGVVEDSDGVVAVLELGDGEALQPGAQPTLPSPAELVPAAGPGTVALVVSATPAGGAGPAGASYRQLTDGRIPARQRVLLAVRASRVDVDWSGDELRRCLDGSLRRIGRRLRQDGIAVRQLSVEQVAALLDEASEGSGPVREGWTGIRLGGLRQTNLRVLGLDRLAAEVAEQFIARLLALPAASTTIGWCACAAGTELTVRLGAGTPAGLAAAVATAHRLAGTAGAVVERLDGQQRRGLAATLPLARPPGGSPGGEPGARPDGEPGSPEPATAPRFTPAPSGLVLGHNRHGQPVTVRLFRPEPTRTMLLGGVPAAQVLTMRALAVGAQVVVQTARPQAWEPFLRAVSLPTGGLTVVPLGSPVPAPFGPLVPQLVVVDAGMPDAPAVPAAAWRASLLLREDVSAPDIAELSRADLVILQPLRPDEAALVGDALGLDASRDWLGRLPADMVGAVSRAGAGRSAVRWAVLSATLIERQVIGAPERVATG